MGFVDIAAVCFDFFAVRMGNDDMTAVGNTKKFVIPAVDKADSLRRFLHMSVEIVGNIGVTVEIVVAGGGNTAEKIGVLLGVNPITIFTAEIPHKSSVRVSVAVFQHGIPVTEQTDFPQFVNHGIKFGGKFGGSVAVDLIFKFGIKGAAAVSELAPQQRDTAALRHNLIALRVGVIPFLREHFTDIQIHWFSPSLSVIRNCPNSVKAYQLVRSKRLSLNRPFVRTRPATSRLSA